MLAVTFYELLKFAHVALVVAWVGGALMISILADALRSKLPGRAAVEAEGADAPVVKQRIRTVVTVARVDLLVLFTVVFFMVTKVGQ
jgi:hypothetical protein